MTSGPRPSTGPKRRRPGLLAATLVVVVGILLTACGNGGANEQNPLPPTPAMVCTPADGSGNPVPPEVNGVPLSDDHAAKVQELVGIAEELGVPERGQVIAVMVALAENTLENVDWVRGFFEDLLALPDWKQLPLVEAIQAIHAVTDSQLFAPFEQVAYQILGYVKQVVCEMSISGENPNGAQIVAAAEEYLGTPYVWGGGGFDGPSDGGFDCSGLTQYAYNQVGIRIPRTVSTVWDQVRPIYPEITDKEQIAPGDLLIFIDDTGFPHHIGIATSNNSMIHAPRPGEVVERVDDMWSSETRNREFAGALRPTASIPGV